MCDVKLIKLREIDVKKYVFKTSFERNGDQEYHSEFGRLENGQKIQELNNVLIDAEKNSDRTSSESS